MKVLVVSQYFWPENFRVNDLCAGLVERGHEVTVLTGIPNYPQGSFYSGYSFFRPLRQLHKSVTVFRVPLIPRGSGTSLPLVLNYLSFMLVASLLGPLLCRDRYDVIFVFETSPITVGIPAILMKKLKRLPILFWVLDLWPESLSATGMVKSPFLLKQVERLVRFIYRHCDRILLASSAFGGSVAEMGAKSVQTRYFPNWIEPEYLDPAAPSTGSVPSLPEGFRVMFAGNIGSAQSFETILAASERLKEVLEVKWIIIGGGRRANWVRSEVSRRGLENRVYLLGQFPSEKMPGFFAQADAMLVTLKRNKIFELTVPGKVQSYMACARPIVAALDGEGAKVVTESGAGIAVPAEDPKALADAVLRMYRMSREEREEMGRRGKEYCTANFDREMLLSRLENLMREVAGKQ